jgi:hypothetical protein
LPVSVKTTTKNYGPLPVYSAASYKDFLEEKNTYVSFDQHFNINSNHSSDELKLPVCVGEKMWKTNPYCQFALVILLQGLFFPTLRYCTKVKIMSLLNKESNYCV